MPLGKVFDGPKECVRIVVPGQTLIRRHCR